MYYCVDIVLKIYPLKLNLRFTMEKIMKSGQCDEFSCDAVEQQAWVTGRAAVADKTPQCKGSALGTQFTQPDPPNSLD